MEKSGKNGWSEVGPRPCSWVAQPRLEEADGGSVLPEGRDAWIGAAVLGDVYGQIDVLVRGTQTLGLRIVPTTRFSGI